MTDGFVMVPNSLIESKLSIWATAVWIALKYHADRNGGCYPSREALAKASKMSLPQVTRALRELREAGMIDANLRAGRTSVYDLPVCSIRSGCDPIDQESDLIDQGVCSNRSDTPPLTDSDEQDLFNKTQEQDNMAERPKKSKNKKDDRFDEFWKAYPKKVKKSAAQRAWNALHVNGEFGEIMSALEKFKQDEEWTKQRGKFIPHPASWLNGRRWEDQIDELHHKTPFERRFEELYAGRKDQ